MIFHILTEFFADMWGWAPLLIGSNFKIAEISLTHISYEKQYRPIIKQYCPRIQQYCPSHIEFHRVFLVVTLGTGKGKVVKSRCCPATVNPISGICALTISHCLFLIQMGRRSESGSQETLPVLTVRNPRRGIGWPDEMKRIRSLPFKNSTSCWLYPNVA